MFGWKHVDWHELPKMGTQACIVDKANDKIIAILPWDTTGLRGVRGNANEIFQSIDQRDETMKAMLALPELLDVLMMVEALDRAPTAGEKRRISAAIAKAKGGA